MPDYENDQQSANERLGVDFVVALQGIMKTIHDTAVKNGHWNKPVELTTLICWIQSEASEIFTAWQHGNKPSTKIPQFTSIEEEAADVFIMLADTCQAKGINLAEAVVAKMAYNKTREHKHGKVN